MKTLITLALLAFGALAVQAQTTTNIAYRIQVETVTGGVTNTVNTNWRYDYGTKKDSVRIDGIAFAYKVYTNSLATNDVALALGPWLKRQHQALVDDYAAQAQRASSADTLAKLTSLLTANIDLLSASDLSSLATIAAKAP